MRRSLVRSRRKPIRAVLHLETLEDRRVPAAGLFGGLANVASTLAIATQPPQSGSQPGSLVAAFPISTLAPNSLLTPSTIVSTLTSVAPIASALPLDLAPTVTSDISSQIGLAVPADLAGINADVSLSQLSDTGSGLQTTLGLSSLLHLVTELPTAIGLQVSLAPSSAPAGNDEETPLLSSLLSTAAHALQATLGLSVPLPVLTELPIAIDVQLSATPPSGAGVEINAHVGQPADATAQVSSSPPGRPPAGPLSLNLDVEVFGKVSEQELEESGAVSEAIIIASLQQSSTLVATPGAENAATIVPNARPIGQNDENIAPAGFLETGMTIAGWQSLLQGMQRNNDFLGASFQTAGESSGILLSSGVDQVDPSPSGQSGDPTRKIDGGGDDGNSIVADEKLVPSNPEPEGSGILSGFQLQTRTVLDDFFHELSTVAENLGVDSGLNSLEVMLFILTTTVAVAGLAARLYSADKKSARDEDRTWLWMAGLSATLRPHGEDER